MALAVVANYSCGEVDNPVEKVDKATINVDGKDVEVGLVASLLGAPGEEVTITLGSYSENDETYAVNFGDGFSEDCIKKVGYQNMGPVDPENGGRVSATTFTGTVGNEGVVKIYGNSNLWLLGLMGNIIPFEISEERMNNLVELRISGAPVDEFKAENLDKLETLSITNTPVETVDVTMAQNLKNLSIIQTAQSTCDSKLASINLSSNKALKNLTIGAPGTTKVCPMTSIDLRANINLESVNLQNNQLTEILFGENKITDLYVQNNKLESLDLRMLTKLKNLWASNNLLTSIDLSYIVEKGRANIDNNCFTLATLPTKPANISASKYTYAPQPALEVPASAFILDLTDQLTTQGVLDEPATTEYTFVTASGTTLELDEDYEVITPGKFRFLKTQTEKVHGVLTTAAFPKFTGANAYVTTEFDAVEAPNTIFECVAGPITTGGFVTSVRTMTGTAEDAIDYLDYKKYKNETSAYYYNTIRVNGTKESIANKPFNYIRVDLDEPLKMGNIIRFTGFRLTPPSDHAQLYLLFDLLNDDESRYALNYFPGDKDTFEYTFGEMFANIWENGLVPNTQTLLVNEAIKGSKSFKIALNPADTEVYLTKIEVLRKAE
jgi:hypothetical protein